MSFLTTASAAATAGLELRRHPVPQLRVIWDVADPDPHHFDGDHDGIGCES